MSRSRRKPFIDEWGESSPQNRRAANRHNRRADREAIRRLADAEDEPGIGAGRRNSLPRKREWDDPRARRK